MDASLFSTYSRDELLGALRALKNYKSALTQIGNRAILKDATRTSSFPLRVEYAPHFSLDIVKKATKEALSSYFHVEAFPENTSFVPSETLVGGMRVFYGDDMLDVSFQKFKNAMNSSSL